MSDRKVKPMCWLRDEWSCGCLYAVYKCKHQQLAISQFKGMDAPACPGICERGNMGVLFLLVILFWFTVVRMGVIAWEKMHGLIR